MLPVLQADLMLAVLQSAGSHGAGPCYHDVPWWRTSSSARCTTPSLHKARERAQAALEAACEVTAAQQASPLNGGGPVMRVAALSSVPLCMHEFRVHRSCSAAS